MGFFPLCLFGQISLDVNDFSDGGDVTWISTATDPLVDYSTTGANTTWDYSSLTYQGQDPKEYFDMSGVSTFVNFIFGPFANAAYQATNYTSSTAIPVDQITSFLPITIEDIFQFSKNSSSKITSVGFALSIDGNEVPFKSDTIETRYTLPLNYGDSYTSRGYTNLDMNPFYNGIWRQHRYRQSEVDGWGSVTTPYGTFDALRVRHLIEESDSIFMEIAGNSFWIPLPVPDRYEYEWWTNGQKEPVLKITTSMVLGSETVTGIEYLDEYHSGVGLEELDVEVSVYPNPAVDLLHVEGAGSFRYQVVSADGALVAAGESEGTVDVSPLSAGNYLLLIHNGKELRTLNFIRK